MVGGGLVGVVGVAWQRCRGAKSQSSLKPVRPALSTWLFHVGRICTEQAGTSCGESSKADFYTQNVYVEIFATFTTKMPKTKFLEPKKESFSIAAKKKRFQILCVLHLHNLLEPDCASKKLHTED